MNEIERVCALAVEKQEKAYGKGSEETKITKLCETDDLYIIDFRTPGGKVIYGGGGLIVHKESFAIQHYCIPSFPKNIFEILDSAQEIEVPKKYKHK
jgi:hypothetical protein